MTGRVRRAAGLLAVAVTALLVLAPRAGSLGAEPPGIEVESVDVTSFPEVGLTVSLPTQFAGAEVPSGDFKLTENGTAREVRAQRVGSSGLGVVVLIDTSGSMKGEPIVAAKAAALTFVERLPKDAKVAVVGFSDAPHVVAGFTTDRTAIATAVDSLTAKGETALNDGVLTAADLLDKSGATQKSIVLLSDGGDTVSKAPIEQVAGRLTGANTGVTAIELKTGETDRVALDRITKAAGGRVESVDDPQALDATYAAIAARLSNLYELRFTSSGAPRADVKVSVDHDGENSDVVAPITYPDLPAQTTVATTPEITAAQPFVDSGPTIPGWMLLLFGILFTILGTALVGYFLLSRRAPARRLAAEYEGTGVEETDGGAWLTAVANQAAAVGDQLATRGGQDVTMDARLDAAGLSMRAGELVALVAALTLAAAMFGFLFLGGFGFLLGLVLPAILTPFVLNYLRDRRRAKFADQLGDTLVLLSSSLRAGYGVVQAVDAVAREADEPMSTEFGRVVTESRLGRDLNDAMRSVVHRTGSEDFEWVVEAIEIHREVGGDLTEVLDHVGETIRSRTRLARQISSLSAEGKLSAIVLVSLPFAIGVFISLSNPGYLHPLWETTGGKIMLVVAAGLLVAGGLWLRKIVKPEF